MPCEGKWVVRGDDDDDDDEGWRYGEEVIRWSMWHLLAFEGSVEGWRVGEGQIDTRGGGAVRIRCEETKLLLGPDVVAPHYYMGVEMNGNNLVRDDE